jgi:HSP20 family protein
MSGTAVQRSDFDWPRRWGRFVDAGWPGRFGWLGDLVAETEGWFRVEEIEEDGALVVRAELPGIDPERDLEVSVSDSTLHIEARREQRTEAERQGVVRSEFRYGELSRDLALPDGADKDAVGASYKDGILEVRVPLPTAEERPVTKVPIQRS